MTTQPRRTREEQHAVRGQNMRLPADKAERAYILEILAYELLAQDARDERRHGSSA